MSKTRVFDLPVFRTSRWIFNCYVVEGDDDQSTIVDAGLPSIASDAIAVLQDLGRNEHRVSSLCTHGHSDHVGGMPRLRDQLQCKSYLPRRCEDYLGGERPRVFGTESMVRFLPVLSQQRFSFGALREAAAGSTRIGFGDGRDFRFPYAPDGFLSAAAPPPGMSEWEVIEAPGHTDDALCFYHRDSATLISGDVVVTLNGRAWFNPEWVDAQASEETEERLRALHVRHLLPGHGLPISGDVWGRALSFRDRPPAHGVLARCARALGNWKR